MIKRKKYYGFYGFSLGLLLVFIGVLAACKQDTNTFDTQLLYRTWKINDTQDALFESRRGAIITFDKNGTVVIKKQTAGTADYLKGTYSVKQGNLYLDITKKESKRLVRDLQTRGIKEEHELKVEEIKEERTLKIGSLSQFVVKTVGNNSTNIFVPNF